MLETAPIVLQVDSVLHAAVAGTEVAGVGSETYVAPSPPPEDAGALLNAAVAGMRTLPRRAASAYDRVAVAAICRAAILSQLDRVPEARTTLAWIIDHDADIVNERYAACCCCSLLSNPG